MKIWENERKEAECIDFKLLYKHIVNYISTEKKNWQGRGNYSSRVAEISEAFDFKFYNQDEYKEFLNSIQKSY